MTKMEFTSRLAGVGGWTKQEAEKILSAVLDSAEDALAVEGSLAIKGFGSFYVKKRQKRSGRNPATGENIEIPETNNVIFRPSSGLKALLANRQS